MVRKKAKANSAPDKGFAPTNNKKVENNPAPEAVVLAESPVVITEPIPEKASRASKKAAKTNVVESIAVKSGEEVEPVSKKTAKEKTSEKPEKMKRLTLDIAKPLHKAIKARAVEEGIPMVDMLRSLLEKYYGNP